MISEPEVNDNSIDNNNNYCVNDCENVLIEQNPEQHCDSNIVNQTNATYEEGDSDQDGHQLIITKPIEQNKLNFISSVDDEEDNLGESRERVKRRMSMTKGKKKKKFREYKCDWVGCDAVLHTTESIKRHKAKHQGKLACQVEGCNYVAGSKRYLRQHLISHSTDRPFQCEHCGNRFKSESAMMLHIRKVHSEQCSDIPYMACDYEGCDFKTKLGWHLKNHKQSHSRSMICETCGKRFNSKQQLSRHTVFLHF